MAPIKRTGVVVADDVHGKLEKIFAALGLGIERDMSKVSITPHHSNDPGRGWYLDLEKGITQADLLVSIEAVIHHIASFKDPCKTWFRKHSLDKKLVNDCIKSSQELGIIIDLDNFLKHGEERPGEKTQTGLFPRLRDVRRVIASHTTTETPKSGLTIRTDGSIETEGEIALVLLAQVVSKSGQVLGELPGIQKTAIQAWETLLRTHKFLI